MSSTDTTSSPPCLRPRITKRKKHFTSGSHEDEDEEIQETVIADTDTHIVAMDPLVRDRDRDQDAQGDGKRRQVKNQADGFRLGQVFEQMVESAVTKAFKAQAEVLAIMGRRIDDIEKRLKEGTENPSRMVTIEDSEDDDESVKELIKILEVPWTKCDQVTRVLDDKNLYEKAKELAGRRVRNGKGVYGINFNKVFFHKDFVGRCWVQKSMFDDPREGYLYGERHAILPMKVINLFTECSAGKAKAKEAKLKRR